MVKGFRCSKMHFFIFSRVCHSACKSVSIWDVFHKNLSNEFKKSFLPTPDPQFPQKQHFATTANTLRLEPSCADELLGYLCSGMLIIAKSKHSTAEVLLIIAKSKHSTAEVPQKYVCTELRVKGLNSKRGCTKVQIRSALAQIRSALAKIRSALVKIRSALVQIRSALDQIRSALA